MIALLSEKLFGVYNKGYFEKLSYKQLKKNSLISSYYLDLTISVCKLVDRLGMDQDKWVRW